MSCALILICISSVEMEKRPGVIGRYTHIAPMSSLVQSSVACDPIIASFTKQSCLFDVSSLSALAMQEMKRALFVYAKLNPGIKYVQGMNEIYAPIYHQFATDTDADSAQHAEGDAFFCFVELVSEFRDHFCQHLVRTARQCSCDKAIYACGVRLG